MTKLWLRIRISLLDARILVALEQLNAMRQRRDRAQARLEEIQRRESRRLTIAAINRRPSR